MYQDSSYNSNILAQSTYEYQKIKWTHFNFEKHKYNNSCIYEFYNKEVSKQEYKSKYVLILSKKNGGIKRSKKFEIYEAEFNVLMQYCKLQK